MKTSPIGNAGCQALPAKALRRFCRNVAAFLVALLLSAAWPAPAAHAAGQEEEFVARREFRGFVRRDMAEQASKTAAELMAMDHAVRLLAMEPDLHFLNAADTGVPSPPPLDGLARMLFATPVTAKGMQGFPPHVHAITHVRLLPPDDMRRKLLAALTRQDLLELYGQTLTTQRSLIARYDALASQTLPLIPADGGGKKQAHLLQSIINEMIAMDDYLSLLVQYEQHWKMPQKAQEALRKMHVMAPKNPLILTSLAEALLQLDRAPAAMEHVGDALRISPEFARAHDLKGTILLRQRLPALAVESFSKALALSPRNVAYYVHRASAFLVLENMPAMCADFQSACALGDCEGLQWAKSVGKCR